MVNKKTTAAQTSATTVGIGADLPFIFLSSLFDFFSRDFSVVSAIEPYRRPEFGHINSHVGALSRLFENCYGNRIPEREEDGQADMAG
jgi:hypothetical protein